MSKYTAKEFSKSLGEGLKYPWGKASRQWNILWVLIPIFGWFALIGYFKKIIQELVKGNTKTLPAFGGFWKNFTEGLMAFVFLIPTIVILSVLNAIPVAGNAAAFIIQLFILPWLVINFLVKGDFASLWEVKKAFFKVFNNAVDYLWALLKQIVYWVVYGVLSIVLVGIPGYAFGPYYFLADFYRRNH